MEWAIGIAVYVLSFGLNIYLLVRTERFEKLWMKPFTDGRDGEEALLIVVPALNTLALLTVILDLIIGFIWSQGKKVYERFQFERIRKKNPIYADILLILKLKKQEEKKEKTDSLHKVRLKIIEDKLQLTMKLMKKNENEQGFQKAMTEYEEVMKNTYAAMKKSIAVKDCVTPEITKDVVTICRDFLEALQWEEAKVMQDISKSLTFEKDYLKKINENRTSLKL